MKKSIILILSLIGLIIFACKKDSTDIVQSTQPTADYTFSIDTSKYPLMIVNYVNKSSNSSSYLWDFGDGQTSTLKDPTHQYTTPGNYKTKLTAYNNDKNSSIIKDITINKVAISGVTFTSEDDITIREVYYSPDTTVYDHIAFPDIVRLSDGSFLVTWREATEHMQKGKGKFMKSFGSSDGKSWTNAELLYDDPTKDDRDISLNRLSNGTIIGDFFKSDDGGCFVLKSFDEGKTFTNPIRINSLGGWAVPSSQAVEINGTVYIPTYGNTNDNKYAKSRVIMFKSNDMGNTWTEELTAPDNTKGWDLQEPAILQANNNRIIMHVRSADALAQNGLGKMLQSYSDDNGKTWTTWKAFNFIGHAPELYKTESGVLISAFRWINSAATETYVGMIYSIDNGNTWSDVIKVAESDYECGYPSIESMGNDKFIIVYYRTIIVGNTTKMQINSKIYQCHPHFTNLINK